MSLQDRLNSLAKVVEGAGEDRTKAVADVKEIFSDLKDFLKPALNADDDKYNVIELKMVKSCLLDCIKKCRDIGEE